MRNLLKRTRAYLAGSVESSDDPGNWRDEITPRLTKLGITVLNPLVKPSWLPKIDGEGQRELNKGITSGSGNHDIEINTNEKTRRYCLALARMADFIIVKIDPSKWTVGTWEEISQNIEKPILVFSPTIYPNLPSMWLYAQLKTNQSNINSIFFENPNSIIKFLRTINNGICTADYTGTIYDIKHLDFYKWIFITRNF
jgi:hypothetical protein